MGGYDTIANIDGTSESRVKYVGNYRYVDLRVPLEYPLQWFYTKSPMSGVSWLIFSTGIPSQEKVLNITY